MGYLFVPVIYLLILIFVIFFYLILIPIPNPVWSAAMPSSVRYALVIILQVLSVFTRPGVNSPSMRTAYPTGASAPHPMISRLYHPGRRLLVVDSYSAL